MGDVYDRQSEAIAQPLETRKISFLVARSDAEAARPSTEASAATRGRADRDPLALAAEEIAWGPVRAAAQRREARPPPSKAIASFALQPLLRGAPNGRLRRTERC